MRHPRTVLAGILLGALTSPALLSSVAAASDKYVLDLTVPRIQKAMAKAEVRAERECKTFSGSGGGSSAPRPKLRLELNLVELSPKEPEIEGEIVSKLRLTNVGDKRILLPWDWNRLTVYSDYCSSNLKRLRRGWAEADISLLFGDDGRLMGSVVLPHLYADLDKPSTYRVLLPGESALLKVPARLFLSPGPANWGVDLPSSLPERFAVSVGLQLATSSTGWYEAVRSANTITVTVPKPGTAVQ